MGSPAEDFAEGLRLHQGGRLAEAEARYRQVLEREPAHAGSLHLLGVLSHQRGEDEQAIDLIGRAIVLVPDRAVYRNNHGVALRALGRLEEALDSFSEALRLWPEYADAHSNFGVALHEGGELNRARFHFEAALRLTTDHVDALYGLGNLLRDFGQYAEAIERLREANRLDPRRTDILNNLGITFLEDDRTDSAIACFHSAVELDPSFVQARIHLGVALAQADRSEAAAKCYADCARLRPNDPLWPVRIAALCPAVFPNEDAIDNYRSHLQAVLDAHRGIGLPWDDDDPAVAGCVPSFNLVHHGRDERGLREQFAAIFREPAPRPDPAPRAGPARIGFVVTPSHEGVFLRCMAGLIERLDRDHFEPIVFGSERRTAMFSQEIRRPSIPIVPLISRLSVTADRIRSARCDLLFHWEVGTDPLNYRLPYARLAPVQCTSWGVQATTGVGAVDYYLSSELVERSGAEVDYTETLVRLPGLLSYQRRSPQPDPPPSRQEFSLPEDVTLYACLQRPLKLHPMFDPLFAEILRRDRRGILLLLSGRWGHVRERLMDRFRMRMPDVAGRIIMLPSMDAARYHRLLAQVDVTLDPIPYGCGSSCYDIFSYNLPLVTLPGARNSGRYAQACYRKMGLPDLVSESPEAYIEFAVRLGTEKAYRAAVLARIAATSDVLFEDDEAVRSLEGFLHAAVKRSWDTSPI